MKKYFSLLVALTLSAGLLAPQGLSAQKRAVKVQGHPHEYFTRQAAGRWQAPPARLTGTPTDNIDPADIKCWVGNPDPGNPIDSAILLVKFTDGKRTPAQGDSILAWGYRYNSVAYGDSVPVHTLDMLRAVANADSRFLMLIQDAGLYGYTVGGIGYSYTRNCSVVPVQYDLKGAQGDSRILFDYTGDPDCENNQVAVPQTDPAELGNNALTEGEATGVIVHPLDVRYGYPAYDYDYWVLTNPTDSNYEWQSGWYNGSWSFYSKDDWAGPFSFAPVGIGFTRLHNHSVNGFVFSPAYPAPAEDMSGGYVAAPCDCRECPR